MHIKRNFVIGLFVSLTAVFFVAEGLTVAFDVKYSMLGLARIEVVSPEQFSAMSTQAVNIDNELVELRAEVSPVVKGVNGDLNRALAIKEWVMNQESECGLGIAAFTPYAVLTGIREGKSATCGMMSLLYWGALKSVDMEARLIQLARSIYNRSSTHVVVEVLIENKWVVIDPYFNTYYLINGKLASAMDMHQLLLGNKQDEDFEVVEGGNVLFPVKYDAYPVDPILYYNNVFMSKRNFAGTWQKIPLLHYYFANSYYMTAGNEDYPGGEIELHNLMSLAYDFFFPIGFGVSFLGLMASLFIPPKRKSESTSPGL